MKNKFSIFNFQFSILFLAVLLLMLPAFSFAQENNLIPCWTEASPHPCEFKDVLTLINNLVRFALFDLVVPIAAIMFFYAGFLMIVPGGESASKRTKAKGIFTNAVIGLAVAVAAWLIVHAVLGILGYSGEWIGF